jgi:septum formation protein
MAFDVVPSGVEETLPTGMAAAAVATRLALAKARDVAARVGPAIVLGADTLVVVDGRLLGKPASREDGRAMLRALAGRPHDVVTAVAVVEARAGKKATEAVVSRVVMRPYSEADIDAYLATGEADDKAGAYAVQGQGGRLVAAVDGCFTNVIGLPLRATVRLLRAFDLPVVEPDALTEAAVRRPGESAPR